MQPAAEAIRQAVLRYCRGVDRLDAELMLSAYHDGATDDHGVFAGSAADLCARVVRSQLDTWWGRYLDRYECREGRWAIVHRTCVHEWTRTEPLGDAMPIEARGGEADVRRAVTTARLAFLVWSQTSMASLPLPAGW
jgi:hypothetical protein